MSEGLLNETHQGAQISEDVAEKAQLPRMHFRRTLEKSCHLTMDHFFGTAEKRRTGTIQIWFPVSPWQRWATEPDYTSFSKTNNHTSIAFNPVIQTHSAAFAGLRMKIRRGFGL